MNYLLFINTPDGDGETCEEFDTVESAQKRKDGIYDAPWLTTVGLDVYLSDEDGNEVELK